MQLLTKSKIFYQAKKSFTQAKNMNYFREDSSFTKLHKHYPDKGEVDNPIQNVH